MDKYEKLVEAVECVIESFDYLNIKEVNRSNHKYSICTHGKYVYEGCDPCICDFLSKALEDSKDD